MELEYVRGGGREVILEPSDKTHDEMFDELTFRRSVRRSFKTELAARRDGETS
jgi:hypothetical protein